MARYIQVNLTEKQWQWVTIEVERIATESDDGAYAREGKALVKKLYAAKREHKSRKAQP